MDTAHYIKQWEAEVCLKSIDSPVDMYTDSRSLYDASQTTSLVSDRRLRVELSAIREKKEEGEINMNWVKGDTQLADALLTKKGASPHRLLKVLGEGKIEK